MSTELTNTTPSSVQSTSAKSKKNEYLIKRCSIFDVKQQSMELLDSIVDVVVEGGNNMSLLHHDTSLERVKSQVEDKMSKLDLNQDDELAGSANTKSRINCSTCSQSFSTREEQIDHFKCDFHLFNLKQKLKGKPVVSPDEFENLTEISSISGCDDDSDDDENKNFTSSDDDDDKSQSKGVKSDVKEGSPQVAFRLKDSTVLTMMKCLLHSKKNPPESGLELIKLAKSITPQDKWCVILLAAGHFAAAVFKGNEPILHKTFHRYVVRAKRGTVQSQHDAGKFAKSAGANIRRQQEASLKDDIRMLIGTEWKAHVDSCKCVFIRVPHYNRSILINVASASSSSSHKLAPFDKTDLRVRNVPFVTFRPTFNEVKRVHSLLSRIENYQSAYFENSSASQEGAIETTVKSKTSKQASGGVIEVKHKVKEAKSVKESPQPARKFQPDPSSRSDTDDDDNQEDSEEFVSTTTTSNDQDFVTSLSGQDLKFFNDVYTACMTNNASKLNQIVSEFAQLHDEMNQERRKHLVESLLNKRLNKDNGFTLLHLTSQLGFAECVWNLLEHGCDPSTPDLSRQSRVAYLLSANKPTRDQYRRFANDHPNRYDYVRARVDEPLNADKLNERMEREKEKRRKKNKQKKQREAQIKEKQRVEEMESSERQRFLELTDQEKKKLILGRNFLNIVPMVGDDVMSLESKMTPVNEFKIISRCWYCGVDNSSNVPFEYFDYKFCSTKCLKSHREQQQKSAKK